MDVKESPGAAATPLWEHLPYNAYAVAARDRHATLISVSGLAPRGVRGPVLALIFGIATWLLIVGLALWVIAIDPALPLAT